MGRWGGGLVLSSGPQLKAAAAAAAAAAGASESVTVLVGTGGFGGSSFYKHSKTPQSLLVTLAGAS